MLDSGFYTNLFEVIVPEKEIDIMTDEKIKHPNLKDLRNEIDLTGKEVFIYSLERSEKVYGYGKDMELLSSKGFNRDRINLHVEPRLTGKMILEGVLNKAKEFGYSPIFGKERGRYKLFNWDKYNTTSNNQVRVYMGYDIRIIFLREPVEDRLYFNIIVDITYSIKDLNDSTLNYNDIISRFGPKTLREFRQIQKDLIPTGINREVSRQRLIEDIIPFVKKLEKIKLPCNIEAKIIDNPSRIILGGENEIIW